ncbi:hypothetical protein TKK_0000381 [Trichogramma kaykai]|uniref:hydroxymethylglutaryl-CoA lyase n=1 Tax=Trichogramma kaykai TaxID=54128 RepID=A0ABD2VXN2_9HYME
MFSRNCLKRAALSIVRRGYADEVRLVEVGPRDGLQNLPQQVPTATKVELVERLAATGLRTIEAASLVSARWVPQMSDGPQVLEQLSPREGVRYAVLAPNAKGAREALRLGAREVVLIAAASESFSKRNTNCSVAEGLERVRAARQLLVESGPGAPRVRAVLSCAIACPYDGPIAAARVAEIAGRLLDMGCDEVGLADTVGTGTPKAWAAVLGELRAVAGPDALTSRLAAHCHDTYGQALASIYECLDQGLRVFDASVAGLGGCPYAPGALGNVATEDLVHMLHGEGMKTGVDLDRLVDVGDFITKQINVSNCSRVGKAILAKRQRSCR